MAGSGSGTGGGNLLLGFEEPDSLATLSSRVVSFMGAPLAVRGLMSGSVYISIFDQIVRNEHILRPWKHIYRPMFTHYNTKS